MRAAYAEHEILANLPFEQRRERWLGYLERGERLLVAEDDGAVVAFAAIGPSRDEAGVGEVYAIYADPEAWGRGIGRRLFDAAAAELREAGFAEATLWVLATNERARRFYERAGWQTDGAEKLDERLPAVAQVRYRRALSAA
jgi:ribosomal protein S18 acetylase RimI-like enzyme